MFLPSADVPREISPDATAPGRSAAAYEIAKPYAMKRGAVSVSISRRQGTQAVAGIPSICIGQGVSPHGPDHIKSSPGKTFLDFMPTSPDEARQD
jgi:hypothetical protein